LALSFLVLAVPGGCIQETPVLGHFEIHNRTTDALIIRAEHAEPEALRVDACDSAVLDDFPLNSVDVSADGRANSLGFRWGVDDPPLIILVTSSGPERLASPPVDVPECRGHLP
jgi:hypothetical protein